MCQIAPGGATRLWALRDPPRMIHKMQGPARSACSQSISTLPLPTAALLAARVDSCRHASASASNTFSCPASVHTSPCPSVYHVHRRAKRSVQACSATVAVPAAAGSSDAIASVQDLQEHLAALKAYCSTDGCTIMPEALPQALIATEAVRAAVAEAVNSKSVGVKGLQNAVVSSGAVKSLIGIAHLGHPAAYCALQILCYRNVGTCQQLISEGIVATISSTLQDANMDLQCAMCFLLTALAAFSDATHPPIIHSGLIPQLVGLCRIKHMTGPTTASAASAPLPDGLSTPSIWRNVRSAPTTMSRAAHAGGNGVAGDDTVILQTRAAAVLRNLAHNQRNHALLIQAGAVDPLVEIMRKSTDPASRINAAVAVACLVGHEEGNPRLQLDTELVVEMLQVLEVSCEGKMRHGTFWTVWKLCQGLASLTVNDRNKELIASKGGIKVIAEVLYGKHHNNEATHRFALSALWNLAFNENSRRLIIETPGLVDAIRSIMATTESTKTKEVAKGALWTLGLEQDVKALHNDGARPHSAVDEVPTTAQHVMLSYEWGCQQQVMLIKAELQKAGYITWMDIDKMSGSTLEAMAKAVEDSAVVLVCVSKRYKESQACRTEAEYAFQQRKKIVPLLMQPDYKPTGWLGALMGTRLYFNVADAKSIPQKMPALIKELGQAGRVGAIRDDTGRSDNGASIRLTGDRPEGWGHTEVDEWLKKIRCSEHAAAFREHGMDGVALGGLLRMAQDSKLIHDTLRGEFGIVTLGQRLRVIEELHRLFV